MNNRDLRRATAVMIIPNVLMSGFVYAAWIFDGGGLEFFQPLFQIKP